MRDVLGIERVSKGIRLDDVSFRWMARKETVGHRRMAIGTVSAKMPPPTAPAATNDTHDVCERWDAKDVRFMEEALVEAKKALSQGEVPVG